MKTAFWISFGLFFYTYIGYGIILYILVRIKRLLSKSKKEQDEDYEPDVTLFVPAFNEKDYVDAKVKNSLSLNYPKDKVKHLWITDGSDDGTPDQLRKYPEVEVQHLPERGGKIGAMNRGMKFVKTPIVIFSDGNTDLGENSIREIVRLFRNPKVGCVSGEKRIRNKGEEAAAGAGEGLYWKYESTLKKWDAELYSVVGAAGELFAVRTELWQEVERDTLLDDFIISLRIAKQGYTIQYNPEAHAIETASANVKEELKRKVRIAAGGIQSVLRLSSLLNPFRYGVLSFQYISHRVLRWTITPFAMLLMLPVSLILAMQYGLFDMKNIYAVMFWGQLFFYFMAFLGGILQHKKVSIKGFFVPYYFFIMNYAVFAGIVRYVKGSQTVNWERAKRG